MDKPLLIIGGGVHSVFKEKYTTGEFRLEYDFAKEFKHFRPLIGGTITFDKALYLCGGIALDLVVGNKVVISPNFAAGYYHKGNGRDLGYPLEFRSGIEAGWRFKNAYRLTLHFYHISNASLGSRNPGVESLDLCLSIPLYFTKCK